MFSSFEIVYYSTTTKKSKYLEINKYNNKENV